jgi:hypothetical protein
VLPEKKATIGDRWKATATSQWAGLGTLTAQSDYRLGEPTRQGDRTLQPVEMTGQHTLDVDMPLFGIPIRGTLATTKMAGTSWFDADAGLVRKGEAKIDFAGTVKLNPDADKPVPLKATFRNTFEWETQP